MGASDYFVGNAPSGASYAAPLVGFQLGDRIAKLPEDYFNATQRRRTLDLQGAFKDGLPRNPDGSINTAAGIDKLVKVGGADYFSNLAPFMIGGDTSAVLHRIDEFANGRDPQGAPGAAPPASPSAPSRPTQPASPGQPQPQLSSAGTDNRGTESLASLASETGVDLGPMLPRIAQNLGVHPADDLSPQQAEQARPMLSRAAQLVRSQGGGQPAQAQAPSSGTSGAPGVPPSNAPETAAPASGITPNNPISAINQAENDPQVKRLLLAEAQARQVAAAAGRTNPKAADAALKQAEGYQARIKIRLDAIAKNAERTTAEKDVLSGAGVRSKELENEVVQSQKTYNGMNAAATQYQRELQPQLALTRSILNQPEMYSGTGASLSLDWNRIKAAFGEQKAAALQEGFKKITASSVLSQSNLMRDQLQEAGGASARIFSQQVDLMNQAAPQLENTLYGNRFLVEVSDRMGQVSIHVAEEARKYAAAHGHLDAKFDQQLSNWIKSHPVFTKDELSHPQLLGAPTIPPQLATRGDQIEKWAQGMGIKAGDPMRAHDGSYMRYQPETKPKQ